MSEREQLVEIMALGMFGPRPPRPTDVERLLISTSRRDAEAAIAAAERAGWSFVAPPDGR